MCGWYAKRRENRREFGEEEQKEKDGGKQSGEMIRGGSKRVRRGRGWGRKMAPAKEAIDS